MLPLIEKDVVDKYRLLSRQEFLEFATMAQTLPGVIAVNCAAFVGKKIAGVAGMMAAVVGSALSAFVLMLLATILLQIIPMEGAVAGAFKGIRAASAALVLAAGLTLGRFNIKSPFAIIVMLTTFTLVLFLNVNVLLVILGAGLTGFLWHQIQTRRKKPAKS